MRSTVLLVFLTAEAAASMADEPTGTIEGRIDIDVGKKDRPQHRDTVEAWAWIETDDGPLPEVPSVKEMRQVGTEFSPSLLVVPRGTLVDFPNDGPDLHNVHWVTPGYSDNLGTYRRGESEQRVFDVPGVYPIGCHRHEWMQAHIVVVPSLWYAPVVDGRFRIDGLPPGTHRVVVWSERWGSTTDVLVEPGSTSELSMTATVRVR